MASLDGVYIVGHYVPNDEQIAMPSFMIVCMNGLMWQLLWSTGLEKHYTIVLIQVNLLLRR